jgi:hypothetical protein
MSYQVAKIPNRKYSEGESLPIHYVDYPNKVTMDYHPYFNDLDEAMAYASSLSESDPDHVYKVQSTGQALFNTLSVPM